MKYVWKSSLWIGIFHTNPETLSPTNSYQETFSKFLAALGLPKILAILEGFEQIFPRKRSLGAPDISKTVSMGLTDRRKTAQNLVDSCKNWKILTVSRK